MSYLILSLNMPNFHSSFRPIFSIGYRSSSLLNIYDQDNKPIPLILDTQKLVFRAIIKLGSRAYF